MVAHDTAGLDDHVVAETREWLHHHVLVDEAVLPQRRLRPSHGPGADVRHEPVAFRLGLLELLGAQLIDPLQAQGNRHQVLLRRIALRDLLERNHRAAAQLGLMDVRPVHRERDDLVGRILAQIEVIRLREARVAEQHDLLHARPPSPSAASRNAVSFRIVE